MLALALALAAAPAIASAQDDGGSEVELIEAGAAPQRPLRHRFRAGQSTRMQVRIRTSMSVSAGGREQSVPVPRMILETTIGPTEILANGHMRYAFRVTRAEVEGGGEGELGERVAQEIGRLAGTHGTTEIDARGTVADFDFELPRGASDQLRQHASSLRDMMGQLLPRFPREPVGVGARWRIRDSVDLPQLSLEIATVYELRRREGDRIELVVNIERATGGGGQLPPGVEVRIDGSGRTLMRLGSLATRQRVESRSEIVVPSPAGSARIVLASEQELVPVR